MNKKFASIIGSAAIVGIGLGAAACSSSPSSPSDLTLKGSATFSGPSEPVVPLTATGSITDHGSINLNTNGRLAVIKLAKGDLKLQHSNRPKTTSYDQTSGVMSEVQTGTFKVVSGTGSYKGANGHGNFDIHMALKFAPGTPSRLAACAIACTGVLAQSQYALPQGGSIVLNASGPVSP
jgi:hypothetical protein